MLKKKIQETMIIVIGNFVLALGITAFIMPSGIITGGGAGIGLIVSYFTGISVSVSVYAINIIMFIIGYFMLGKTFATKTALSTIIYPTFLTILGGLPILQNMTHDTLLSTVCAGLLIGAGMGLVLRQGASTGGMDIPPLVINKRTGLSVAILINILDVSILLGQALFSTIEQVLYGIIAVLITTIVIEKLMLLGESKVQVTIISPQYKEIQDQIYQNINRGCTLLNITTGYMKEAQLAVMSVVSSRELHVLTKIVLEVDPAAFIISNETHSVKGRGFTLPNIDK